MKIKRKRVLKALKALDLYVEIEKVKAENSNWWPIVGFTIIILSVGILIGFGLSI